MYYILFFALMNLFLERPKTICYLLATRSNTVDLEIISKPEVEESLLLPSHDEESGLAKNRELSEITAVFEIVNWSLC